MEKYFEGAFIPFVAKERWPEINENTNIILCNHASLVMPVMPDELLTLFTEKPPPEAPFEAEHIELHRTWGLEAVVALGYGKRSNTLAMRLKQ